MHQASGWSPTNLERSPERKASIDMASSTPFTIEAELSTLAYLREGQKATDHWVSNIGVSRNISFRYPGSEDYALRDVSVRVNPGQLCVIIGSNGSGKGTILKLVARIYDPTEGTVLIDGHRDDVKSLRLEDIRRALAILFQDYTHFPLSVRENVALGDPSRAHDDTAIEEAVRLGGASELIIRLPEGLDTYLKRPVRDLYSGMPDGITMLFGRKVDHGRLRGFVDSLIDHELSGGLDPTAEHGAAASPGRASVSFVLKDRLLDLFSRLRELRGNKTMIFSTYRFGNLTRHADMILYMNDSFIVESGTHKELLNGRDLTKLCMAALAHAGPSILMTCALGTEPNIALALHFISQFVVRVLTGERQQKGSKVKNKRVKREYGVGERKRAWATEHDIELLTSVRFSDFPSSESPPDRCSLD
ncbi:P-loop containing nucleoside triphosphate hydrolase protein [Lactarius quietus]|nr:P-loop containing nucleoside triphosphate hydrolase protein [Lactarius quietus]